jgi:hypothetical protein
VLGFEETGDELGVGGVAYVAPEFLHTEGFDALGIDQIDGGAGHLMEALGNGVAVVAGLLKAGVKRAGRGGFRHRSDEQPDAGRGVVEAFGAGLREA